MELLPTHGEGSFCTASGAGRYTSTIGDELESNPLLRVSGPDELAKEMLRLPMPIPGFYRYMGPTNTLGVKPMPEEATPRLTVAEVLDREDVHIVDMRDRAQQAGGMLPGSIAVEMGIDFGSWAGWLAPYNEPVVIVAAPDQDAEEAVTQLAQIGFDEVVGVVNEVPESAWGPGFELIDAEEAKRLLDGGMQVLDVRMPSELEQVRLPGAIERFAADVFTQGIPADLDPDQPVLVACASGRRAVIAASRLIAEGYTVHVLTGAGIAELVDRAA